MHTYLMCYTGKSSATNDKRFLMNFLKMCVDMHDSESKV